ncbi:hypothetical protein J4226_04765 [Candidatus Pacearchaeota archaeon]|nr:hypothetical protein [Candidatus Pacearchaeota archaeon]
MRRFGKKGDILSKAVIQIILVGLLFAVFFLALEGRLEARGIKQQVLEKELALLIDASESGFSFEIVKKSLNGLVDGVEVRDGRIYVKVDGLPSSKGYPYFSSNEVFVEEDLDKFVVRVK